MRWLIVNPLTFEQVADLTRALGPDTGAAPIIVVELTAEEATPARVALIEGIAAENGVMLHRIEEP